MAKRTRKPTPLKKLKRGEKRVFRRLARPGDNLTQRERDVWELVACEFDLEEIGEMLSIKWQTVSAIKNSLMRKLNLYSSAGLTKAAITHNMVAKEPIRLGVRTGMTDVYPDHMLREATHPKVYHEAK